MIGWLRRWRYTIVSALMVAVALGVLAWLWRREADCSASGGMLLRGVIGWECVHR